MKVPISEIISKMQIKFNCSSIAFQVQSTQNNGFKLLFISFLMNFNFLICMKIKRATYFNIQTTTTTLLWNYVLPVRGQQLDIILIYETILKFRLMLTQCFFIPLFWDWCRFPATIQLHIKSNTFILFYFI